MGKPLVTEIVYFYPKFNATVHNTDRYELVNPRNGEPETTIVRRGQPFTGAVAFNRPYDDAVDRIQLLFTLGNKPHMATQGSVFVKQDVVPNQHSWSAKFLNSNQNYVTFEVSTPVDTPVGSWQLQVITKTKSSVSQNQFHFKQDLYILFNPWNPDDQTYMADTNLLQEYILSDVGKIWVGPIQTTSGKPWVFGQFDDEVLPAIMFMLDKVGMPYQNRGDAVKMARFISAAVNFNDDEGVLVGRWDGEYEDGTAPSEWTGSVDILAQFLKTKETVSYGQCWVFAGVVTTVCRALGIPSRVVSNVVSAHDANCSLTIDKFYTERMEKLDYDPTNPEGADSIWNYHVWNDVWMARPDLPSGYGGWQAIDATPQEKSSNKYQCGPAPLEAIKHGVLGLNYDVVFMLASVNADIMRWRKDSHAESGYSLVDSFKYEIGRIILTKQPYVFDHNGDQDREDITTQYKFTEGTDSERVALMNGVRYAERAKRNYSVASSFQNDVTFKLRDIDTVQIGKDFRVTVDIENTSDQCRHIKASLSAISLYYNGVKANLVQSVEDNIYVGPKKVEQISLLVTACEYLPKLVEYCNMKISAMAFVEETKQSWADDDDFQVLKPNIDIRCYGDLKVGQPAIATLSFENPLDHPLTNCEFRVTSSGIMGRTLQFTAQDVMAHQLLKTRLPVYPNKLGNITLVATFKSTELKEISGSASVEVSDPNIHEPKVEAYKPHEFNLLGLSISLPF